MQLQPFSNKMNVLQGASMSEPDPQNVEFLQLAVSVLKTVCGIGWPSALGLNLARRLEIAQDTRTIVGRFGARPPWRPKCLKNSKFKHSSFKKVVQVCKDVMCMCVKFQDEIP
uniref:Uncharacterized protein n=1 Tax=Aegilops tauschii subsp. strangulata TaxID=200361 RepID=A0A453AYT1_AEGTS